MILQSIETITEAFPLLSVINKTPSFPIFSFLFPSILYSIPPPILILILQNPLKSFHTFSQLFHLTSLQTPPFNLSNLILTISSTQSLYFNHGLCIRKKRQYHSNKPQARVHAQGEQRGGC